MYEWNKTFQKILEIKQAYIDKFGEVPYENYSPEKNVFNYMVSKLENEEYSSWVDTVKISSYKDYLLFHYNLIAAAEEMWGNSDSLNREARGLVIDIRNDEIVNCPFKKFFNIEEVPETKLDVILEKIENASVFEITNKLDGSMQSASYYRGEIVLAGSESVNPVDSWRVSESYEYLDNHPNYKQMITENEGLTFIFESISANDPHVVLYDEDKYGLYLIGVRDKFTGREFLYKEVIDFANKYHTLVTEIESYTLDELFGAKSKFKANEKEGWVLSMDGFKVKFKCDDYLEIHKCYSKKSLPKLVIKAMADGNIDDVISAMPDKYRPIALDVVKIVEKYVSDESNNIKSYFEKAPKDDKKDFAVWIKKNAPEKYFSNLINLYKGDSIEILKSRAGRYLTPKELGLEQVLIVDLRRSDNEEKG